MHGANVDASRVMYVALVAFAVACSGATHRGASPTRAGDPLATLESRRTIDGEPLPARARETTVVVFFASWCGACRAHLADLQQVHRELPSLRIILVNAFEDFAERRGDDALRAYLAEAALPWPVVRGSAELRAAFGNPQKIPAMYVFAADGAERARYVLPARRIPPRDQLLELLAARRP
jgi:thiol-disulfide isomerase/thioredoxin